MLITLREMKRQISMVDVRDRELDSFLTSKYYEAVAYTEKYLGRPVLLEDEEELDAGIKGALLMYIAAAYANREAFNPSSLAANPAFENLLNLYRTNLGV